MPEYRWVIDAAHPEGHAVELTPAEEAALVAERAAAAAEDVEDDAEAVVEATLTARADGAIVNLALGANAIKNGPLFADRTANERAYLELLGRGEVALIRLALRRLDAAD